MANESKRGGMKQGQERDPSGKKHQGVRAGSSAREKDRGHKGPRKKVVPNRAE
jgi:hypothetical protein